MSEVQKYELDCTMEPSDTGAWVEYGKYRDLEIELESRDREIAELREDPYAWYESAQRVNAELRERAERAEDAAYRWWWQARQNNTAAWAHVRRAERLRLRAERAEAEVKEYEFLFELQKGRLDEAIAAWREATGQHNVSPDLGMLLEWLLNRIDELEANLAMAEYDTSPQVSADRDAKVAPEATILQEKDTHFPCKEDV